MTPPGGPNTLYAKFLIIASGADQLLKGIFGLAAVGGQPEKSRRA